MQTYQNNQTLYKKYFSIFFLFVLLGIFLLFKTNNPTQDFLTLICFFIVVPIFYVKMILKENISWFSFKIENWKDGVIWSAFYFMSFGLLFLFLWKAGWFFDSYYVNQTFKNNFWNFIGYELLGTLTLLVAYEFLFLGFLMNVVRDLGIWSVFVQLAIFLLFLLASGGLRWAMFPVVVSVFLGGIVFYKTKTLFYPVFCGWVCLVFLDAFLLK